MSDNKQAKPFSKAAGYGLADDYGDGNFAIRAVARSVDALPRTENGDLLPGVVFPVSEETLKAHLAISEEHLRQPIADIGAARNQADIMAKRDLLAYFGNQSGRAYSPDRGDLIDADILSRVKDAAANQNDRPNGRGY